MEWREILSLLGISGVLSAIISIVVDNISKKSLLKEKDLLEIKIKTYTSILCYMHLIIMPMDYKYVNYIGNRPLTGKITEREIIEYNLGQLKGVYYHLFLYSSSEVIENAKAFIDNPIHDNYLKTAKAMRKDIWGNSRKKIAKK